MRKDRKYMLGGAGTILLGWLSAGFGYTVHLGPQPINTIVFCAGPILFFLGIILFIIGANTKSYEK